MDLLELVLLSICTCAFYFLSNFYTYNVGVAMAPAVACPDVGHEIMPDLSALVTLRDIILPLFLLPFIWVQEKKHFAKLAVEGFMYLVTLKAITIFFTILPPSNPECARKKRYNHCFHQMFSGHNSFVLLLCILYLKFLPPRQETQAGLIAATISYSLFIIMTRAHYTVDVIVSYMIVLFLCA
jgi:hypothetical protein